MSERDDRRDFDHLWCEECHEITNHTTAQHQAAEAERTEA